MSFEKIGRLLIGLYEESCSLSRQHFFKVGVTHEVAKCTGKTPDWSDEFTKVDKNGASRSIHSLMYFIGIGSNDDCLLSIDRITEAISECVTAQNSDKWDVLLAEKDGGRQSLVEARILSIFPEKYRRKA